MAAGAGGRRGLAPAWVAGLGALAILAVLALVIALFGQGHDQARPLRAAGGPATKAERVDRAVRVMLLGDSLAGSLAPGLASGLSAPGTAVFNGGSPGCSLASYRLASNFRFTVDPGPPCVTGRPAALLDTWDRWISTWRPSMVVYLARNDLADQQLGGAWTHVGQPRFNRYYDARVRAALQRFASHGLPVVLMVPNQAESGNRLGVAVPEEEPARRAALAAQLERVVASFPRPHPRFEVVDLGQLLTPKRISARGADPAQLFCPDGAHFTALAGELVARDEQASWGELAPATAAVPRLREAPPKLRPDWWRKLGCDPGAS